MDGSSLVMVRKNKGLLRTVMVSGLAMITAACSSIDSKATQATDENGHVRSAQATQLPMPVAELGQLNGGTNLVPPAVSVALEQINTLNQQQQYSQSLKLTQQLIQQYPGSPDLALMEGVMFNQLNRTDEAEQVFLRLSEKHPELPEPLNNLAVIYVNRGDMNRAISTLQKAFETHPSYARVQSNLRTLYTTLASQAYNRALNLGSQAPAPVLAELDRIPMQNSPGTLHEQGAQLLATNHQAQIIRTRTQPVSTALTQHELAEMQADVIRAAQATTSKPVPASTAATPQPAAPANPVATAAAAPPEPPTPEQPVATQVTPAPVTQPSAEASTTASTPAEPVVDVHAQLKEKLNGWAAAWSAKDVPTYLSFYTDNYRPDRKLSHKRWKQQRQQRLTSPRSIKVGVSGISIKISSEKLAQVSFTQAYKADSYRDKVIKTLTFALQQGQWKIVDEISRKAR